MIQTIITIGARDHLTWDAGEHRLIVWDSTGREAIIQLPGGDEGAAILRPLTTALARWLDTTKEAGR